MINNIKKLSLSKKFGFIFAGLDFVFWLWFFSCALGGASLAEGLMGMMLFHAPASILLPLFGSVVIGFFRLVLPLTNDSLLPQTLFLLIVGIAQYYFIGYFIGWLISKLRRRFGFDKSISEPKTEPKPSRTKTWVLNILYLLFTVSVLQMISDILSNIMLDFEMYKMNYPPTRHYLEAIVFILWLYSAYRIIRYNRRQKIVKNANKMLLIFGILITVVCSGIYIPKWLKADISGVTPLEGLYARQQAKIIFDNPLEKLIIMKTAIVGMDEKNYQVAAYTFFGLEYRLADIEKASKGEMRRLLNPGMVRLQTEYREKFSDVLTRVRHESWPRVTYAELAADNRFGEEMLQGIILGLGGENSIFLRTDYNEHEVYLLVYIDDIYANFFGEDGFVFEDDEPHPEYIINTKDIKISKAHQVAVLYSYRIESEGRPYYMIFDVVSDQKMPTGIDYIWRPDNNIEDEDILQILKNIANCPKEYFDDELKLSFSYPADFFVEDSGWGPHHDLVITPFGPDAPERLNPEGLIYTALMLKKIDVGEEYNELMAGYGEKAKNKEFYPDYSLKKTEINGRSAEVIRYNDVFAGGMTVEVLVDADDYFLLISYFDDTKYSEEYRQVIESITLWSSITEELSARFRAVISNIDINYPEESSLWWDDDDGYSILVPGTESIEIAKDDGSGAEDFAGTSFTRDILDIADEVLIDRGFVLNKRNSSADEKDRKFYDYVRAYEKADELCVIRVNPDYGSSSCPDDIFMCNTVEITCGNDLAGSQAEQRPFLEALELQNKETIATLMVEDDPYYEVNVHGRRAGSAAVLKKEGDGYRVLYIGQEGPPCELMDEEKIPASVFKGMGDGACFSDDGYRSAEKNNY